MAVCRRVCVHPEYIFRDDVVLSLQVHSCLLSVLPATLRIKAKAPVSSVEGQRTHRVSERCLRVLQLLQSQDRRYT